MLCKSQSLVVVICTAMPIYTPVCFAGLFECMYDRCTSLHSKSIEVVSLSQRAKLIKFASPLVSSADKSIISIS